MQDRTVRINLMTCSGRFSAFTLCHVRNLENCVFRKMLSLQGSTSLSETVAHLARNRRLSHPHVVLM